ncbi:family 78 glycoside hydrolase catalytic domain [Aerococcaceae bacterium zg-ZJ1578]|uniref:family 78 glycoside hydrolase catalytic domain n=1 Tax=Aerococcaceae bacterium zg-252 TaxID=2796928 RepID=UPI001A309683|nr:family 78 glycoside hydrolase catalytic domain [Aerococcaceae bacterium zg-1578]
MISISELKIENKREPLGIDNSKPSFSWKVRTDTEDNKQSSYQLVVKDCEQIVWDSGWVQSEQSIYIIYGGEALVPKTKYSVILNVIDIKGDKASYSSYFETGMMLAEHFSSQWITHDYADDIEEIAIFGKLFSIDKKVAVARLYITSLGTYEAKLNGQKIGNEYFAPGWTVYNKRLQYQTYDITALMHEDNDLRVEVGNGWYKGILGFENQGNHFGNRTALLAEIELTFVDGTKRIIRTDESWYCTTGELRYAELYHGTIVDKTSSAHELRPVHLYDYPKNHIVAQESEPVRITERVKVQEIIKSPKGEIILDFGQNLTGVVEAKIKAQRGIEIVLRHAEALDEFGNLYTTNLRTARATDTFIASGNDDVFFPSFTYHGFRYVAVDGLGEDIDPDCFEACVMHTDFEVLGHITTSNEKVNRLWKNIDWTLRSNHFDIPTDCPQRDERFGYTGDAGIFVSTAVFHKNVSLLYQKWLRDVAVESSIERGVPVASPNVLMGSGNGISVWHDAATIVPWVLWEHYGDIRILRERYQSMKDCVEFSRSRTSSDGLIHTGQQLGDWVALDAEKGPMRKQTGTLLNPSLLEKRGMTDRYFVANVYFLNSIKILLDTAYLLDEKSDAEEYRQLFEQVKLAIQKEYVTSSGRLVTETQTSFALALFFDILEGSARTRAIEGLMDNFKEHHQHLTTGFVGTRLLPLVLSEIGCHDAAGELFLQEDCPSWLYSVNLGATTVWELWDGVNEDGSFNPYEMNSLNQYSFASIGEWMYQKLGGLKPIEPAYKKALIKPRLIKGINEVETSLETPYGRLACHIQCKDEKYIIDVEVPFNTTAILDLPEKMAEEIGSGRYRYEYPTKSSFEYEYYTKNSLFKVMLDHEIGLKLLQEHSRELLDNAQLIQFANQVTIDLVSASLPKEVGAMLQYILDEMNNFENNKK